MDVEEFGSKWAQMRSPFQKWWGRLTDADLVRIDGRLDRMIEVLQERYGLGPERIARELFARMAKLERSQRQHRFATQIRDTWKDHWVRLRGQALSWWGILTEADLDDVAGEAEAVIELLQNRYGYTRDLAEAEFNGRVGEHLILHRSNPVVRHD